MLIDKLHLENFRSHTMNDYVFSSGINAIIGPNGSGKTSIVEAISLIASGHSFKGAEDKELVRRGANYLNIEATTIKGKIATKVKINVVNGQKRVYIDGTAIKRLSELIEVLNVVTFEPKEVGLLQGAPRLRRKFLDFAISKSSPFYLAKLQEYDKLLSERNKILKEDEIDETHLNIVTDLLIKASQPICEMREKYVKALNACLGKVYSRIDSSKKNPQIVYEPFVKVSDAFLIEAKTAFKDALTNDLAKKVTSIGPQKDDFLITLNGENVATYGSQGENRIAIIALKLASHQVVTSREEKPVVILDDVLSELDDAHKDKLLTYLKTIDQVFITATHLEKKDDAVHIIDLTK